MEAEHRHEHKRHAKIAVTAYGIWQRRIGEITAGDDVPGDAISDWLEAEKEVEHSPVTAVSFAADILPLFRQIDIDHMLSRGVLLGDYAYMADATGDHANAAAVLATLENQSMPPGGPFWLPAALELFAKWMMDGFAQ